MSQREATHHLPSSDPPSPPRGEQAARGGEPSDGELLDRCRTGGPQAQEAWTRLIQRYERLVFSVPRRLGVSTEIAEETFQEVWAVLLRRLPSLQHDQALPQWLITTARRIALRAAHRARVRSGSNAALDAVGEQLDRRAAELDEGSFVDRVERARQVGDALERLDVGCRDLLVALTRSDHASYAELSRQLGMPIGSIGPKRARCMERLIQLLPSSLRAEFVPVLDGEPDGGS